VNLAAASADVTLAQPVEPRRADHRRNRRRGTRRRSRLPCAQTMWPAGGRRRRPSCAGGG
jgi:hypothetical protein